jgi:hypothetical protein
MAEVRHEDYGLVLVRCWCGLRPGRAANEDNGKKYAYNSRKTILHDRKSLSIDSALRRTAMCRGCQVRSEACCVSAFYLWGSEQNKITPQPQRRCKKGNSGDN